MSTLSTNGAALNGDSRFEYLISATPAVIYSAKPTSDYGATYVSPNIVDQLGYPPSAFTADPAFWMDNIHPEDRMRVIAELWPLFSRGQHAHEYRFRHADGGYRWMYDEMRLVRDGDGNPVEIVGHWLDVTERHQAVEERDREIVRLKAALRRTRAPGGLLPMCPSCKKIQDRMGYWEPTEIYLRERMGTRLDHRLCPDCEVVITERLAGGDEGVGSAT